MVQIEAIRENFREPRLKIVDIEAMKKLFRPTKTFAPVRKPWEKHEKDLALYSCKRRARSFTERTRILVALAFFFAQRPSDIAQWDGEHSKVSLTLNGCREKFFVLTFRRGKVVATTGPWTIHLAWQSRLAEQIGKATAIPCQMFPFMPTSEVRKGKGGLWYPTAANRRESRQQVSRLLKSVNPNLECKSVRRGGAQRLASLGVPHADIRENFTHHANVKTLREYLGYGAFSTTQAEMHVKANRE